MRVGWIGLGKLGLPCAAAIAAAGHDVVGYDKTAPDRNRKHPYEKDLDEYLREFRLSFTPNIGDALDTDIVFVAVQTPHGREYEGTMRLPETRANFDYMYLYGVLDEIAEILPYHHSNEDAPPIVVVSTVLPGTMRKWMVRHPHVNVVYNPFFIAMGTVIHDFTHPDLVLVGEDQPGSADRLADLYKTIHDTELSRMSIESAELTKVAYNTFIGLKIAFANTMMEICHKTGANVDDLVDALAQDSTRILTSKYMYGGMGDGGACHPRDNIAMSWLAQQLDLSADPFTFLMEAREAQTEWFADLAIERQEATGMAIILMGLSYKPNTNLATGSPAVLLLTLLEEKNARVYKAYEPHGAHPEPPLSPAVYVVACAHDEFKDWAYPPGSVVIDPFGITSPGQVVGSILIRVGR